MSTDTKVPFASTDNNKFNRWAIIAAVIVLPKVFEGAKAVNETGKAVASSVKKTVDKATDPFGGLSDDEIYSKLVSGGDKLGVSSMDPLEQKMLQKVIASANKAVGTTSIGEAEDANKLLHKGPPERVLWVILYKDGTTGSLSQMLVVQGFYGHGVAGIDSPDLNTSVDELLREWGAPPTASFSGRITN